MTRLLLTPRLYIHSLILTVLTFTQVVFGATDIHNNIARLAGAQPDGSIAKGSIAWVMSQNHFNYSIYGSSPIPTKNLLSEKRIEEITQFSKQNLSEAYHRGKGLLYLFGGPDFIYPNTFFPEAQTYVLIGLEEIGDIPNAEALSKQGLLQQKVHEISEAYSSLPYRSYFITTTMAKMLVEFGTTTIISLGVVLSGNELLTVEKVSLNKAGELVTKTLGDKVDFPGVRISFRRPDNSKGQVVYFQKNLGGNAFDGYSAFDSSAQEALGAYLKRNEVNLAFYKAASYLSFSNKVFERINQLVFDQMDFIVQTDSGLPLRVIDKEKWDGEIYGYYVRPSFIFEGQEKDYSGWTFQQELFNEYMAGICRDGVESDYKILKEILTVEKQSGTLEQNCGQLEKIFKPWLQWKGTLPFLYGYSSHVESPNNISLRSKRNSKYKFFPSNLIYLQKR